MIKKWKTLSVDEEIYNDVSKKQSELILLNGGKYIQIGLVAEAAIIAGMGKVVLKDGKVDIKE